MFVRLYYLFICLCASEEPQPRSRQYGSAKVSPIRDLLNLTLSFSYGTKPVSEFVGPKAFSYSRLWDSTFRPVQNDELFDFIVVGGGGAGCPLARTLADAGARVALIERGQIRDHHYLSWDLHGAGRAINDHKITQAVQTTEGVISHAANVLGGGTAVNLGFYIEENREYFEWLETHQGFHFDWPALSEAQEWIRKRVGRPSKQRDKYATAIKSFLMQSVVKLRRYVGSSPRISLQSVWDGWTLYEPSATQFRLSADTLLTDETSGTMPPNLTVSSETVVMRVEFEDHQNGKRRARCVLVKEAVPADSTPIISRRRSGVGILQSVENFVQWLKWFPNILDVVLNSGSPTPVPKAVPWRRVCLTDSIASEIILSAGAIGTPWLLFHSGVGPEREVKRLGRKLEVALPQLGQNLTDRIFVPITYFLEDSQEMRSGHKKTPLEPAVIQHLMLDIINDNEIGKGISGDEDVGEPDVWLETMTDKSDTIRKLSVKQNGGCQRFKLGDVNENCSYFGWEELSGGKIAEGVALASRFMFPSRMRGSLIVDLAMQVLSYCSLDRSQRSNLAKGRLETVCRTLQPLLDCFNRAAAHVFLLSEPRSRGHIYVGGPDGRSPQITGNYLQDPQDVIDSVRGISALIKSMTQTRVFDGLLERVNSVHNVGELFRDSCPLVIRKQLANLLYDVTDLWTDLVTLEEARQAEGALRNGSFNNLDLGAHLTSLTDQNIPTHHVETQTHRDYLKRLEAISFDDTVPEIMNATDSQAAEVFTRIKTQRYLSFPPILPDPTSTREVFLFLQRQFTSMWHWHGSAAMGSVVDSKFHVAPDRLTNLAIVDASVLSKLPRMNPQATVMHLGRYVGVIKARQWQSQK